MTMCCLRVFGTVGTSVTGGLGKGSVQDSRVCDWCLLVPKVGAPSSARWPSSSWAVAEPPGPSWWLSLGSRLSRSAGGGTAENGPGAADAPEEEYEEGGSEAAAEAAAGDAHTVELESETESDAAKSKKVSVDCKS
eukprot:GHVT01071414.1.p2 GENE.GHVT01071414.1~~GHVT01071414.1.p2  ORF type:complete len:136 (-),score=30.81 GHVT01071414.1:2963-3370(-)